MLYCVSFVDLFEQKEAALATNSWTVTIVAISVSFILTLIIKTGVKCFCASVIKNMEKRKKREKYLKSKKKRKSKKSGQKKHKKTSKAKKHSKTNKKSKKTKKHKKIEIVTKTDGKQKKLK